MPDTANRELPSSHEIELAKQLKVSKFETITPRRSPPSSITSTSKEIVYETPKQGFIPGDDDDDEITEEEGAQTEEDEKENVGTVASPPRSSSTRQFLDTQYGIRRDGEQLMIDNTPVFIDPENITIKGTAFRGTEGLWEISLVRM